MITYNKKLTAKIGERNDSVNLKLELLGNKIGEIIRDHLNNIDIDINDIAQSTAISVLSEIQECMQNNELSDFDKIETIVLIFEKYHIDYGTCHDFG